MYPVNPVNPVHKFFLCGLAALREYYYPVDDDNNRYTSIGGNTLTHDPADNLTRFQPKRSNHQFRIASRKNK